MVMLAVLLAVAVTYFVWIRRPEQKLIKFLTTETRVPVAFAKPGDEFDMVVTVNNEKRQSVPLLRVDLDLPDELAFADRGDVPRHRTHICTLGGGESITFTHRVVAEREGRAAIESPELIVYGLTGSVIANNVDSRGKVVARLRVRHGEEDDE
ncbi:MAG: hypothetical protein IKL84_04315 [Clostridia bacterium]|nr:hypothetical protein [Clostridia bacterium]